MALLALSALPHARATTESELERELGIARLWPDGEASWPLGASHSHFSTPACYSHFSTPACLQRPDGHKVHWSAAQVVTLAGGAGLYLADRLTGQEGRRWLALRWLVCVNAALVALEWSRRRRSCAPVACIWRAVTSVEQMAPPSPPLFSISSLSCSPHTGGTSGFTTPPVGIRGLPNPSPPCDSAPPPSLDHLLSYDERARLGYITRRKSDPDLAGLEAALAFDSPMPSVGYANVALVRATPKANIATAPRTPRSARRPAAPGTCLRFVL